LQKTAHPHDQKVSIAIQWLDCLQGASLLRLTLLLLLLITYHSCYDILNSNLFYSGNGTRLTMIRFIMVNIAIITQTAYKNFSL